MFTRTLRTAALCCLALVAAGLTACNKPEAKTEARAKAEGALSVPPLIFTHRELKNGLDVYSMPDPNTASVSVQVWYKVGSKDDPPGRSGFAHLFEHLMFKSTSNMPPEFFDRLTEDAGGFNNASTWNDFTNYYEVVPANHLQRVLWGEAERMGSLVVDDANFKPEREVVKNELRQNYLGQPYGRLFLYLSQTAFDIHPYGRPGIGSAEQLDAATLNDVREFHAAYYRPDNAVLVVSGNFDQTQLDQWIDQYFANIKTPDRAIPRVTAVEPTRTAARDFTVYEPNVPLPAVAISWPSPGASSPDVAAWMMLDGILTTGQSSRLYKSMVYDQQVAAEVFSSMEVNEQPGLYSLVAILSDGKTPEEGLASLKAEIERIKSGQVTSAELEEARTELLVNAIDSRETAEGRATELARSVTLYGDAKASDKLLAALQSVTTADVQRVAQQMMDEKQSVTVRYLPEGMKKAGAEGAKIADAATIQATKIAIPAADIPEYALAAEATRLKPPAEGAPVAAKIPSFEEKTLANGLRVVVASRPGLPLVSASLGFGAGSAADPAGKSGLANLTADIATRGTATRSATQIATEIESLGASLSGGAGADGSNIAVSTLSSKAANVFAVMADVAMNPAFADEEIERARSETLDSLMVSLREPGTVASRAMTRILFGGAPYGGVATPNTIKAIDKASLAAFHKTWWRPDNATLVITGDVTPEVGFKLAETAFGQWAKPAEALPELDDLDDAPPGAAKPPRLTVIDIPQIGQAAVNLGQLGPSRANPMYFQTLVANDVLGGGYSARLNAEIRIKRGLSYGVRSNLPSRKARSAIVAGASTGNKDVPAVIDLLSAELKRLGSEPIPVAEMNARKAVLIGGFGRSVETNAGLAGQLAALAQFGLPLNRLATYAVDVGAVTPEQAAEAAKKYYNPDAASIVAVGDAKTFWPALSKKDPKAQRIAIDALKLDSPTLK